MISSLHGTLTAKAPDKIEVSVMGVGFKLLIPLSTFQVLPEIGSKVSIATSLQMRENAVDLVGFATTIERETFEMLISVSGVGVKLALTILSGLKLDDLLTSIMTEDKSVLSSISGIGPKTAGRLVLELKDKVAKLVALTGASDLRRLSHVEEAIMALEALGYSRYEAKKAVDAAVKEVGVNQKTDAIIRSALKVTA